MNKDYDDINGLLADLENDISTIMKTDMNKEVKSIYKEKVDEMYDSYDRSYYEPRYNRDGGFADESNWREHVDKNKGLIEYTLENEALGVDDAYGERIDEIIETGKGYTWRNRPNPRTVYQNTQDEIDSSNTVEKVLEKSLKNKGWN